MSTFKQLQDTALGTSFPESKRALAKDFINTAQGRVHRKARLEGDESATTLSTTANVATVNAPTNMVRARSLFIGDDHIDVVEAEEIEAQIDGTGQPTLASLDAGVFTLWPTPDKVYSIKLRFYANGTTLSADGDVPVGVPADYHDILWKFARADLFADEDDAEMATFWDTRGMARLSELIVDDEDESDEVKQVEGTF